MDLSDEFHVAVEIVVMADPRRYAELPRGKASLDKPTEGSRWAERQRFTRRSILLAATLRDDEGAVECDLIDLSAGGAKVQVAVPFVVGAQLLLTIGDEHSFYSKVAWRDGEFLGLRFIEPPDSVAAAIPNILKGATDGRERRRHVRSSVLWSAELCSGIRRVKCEILNISASGAKLHASSQFPSGTEIVIRSDRFGEFRAEVVWQDSETGNMGVQFLEDEERIAEVIQRGLPSIRKPEG
ncbi:MAG: PilZ domain-containing protein [Kiloniellales bacterium]